MEMVSDSNNGPRHKSSLTCHHRSSIPKSPSPSLSLSQPFSSGNSATTQYHTQPYQQQAYFNAAKTNDPFFQPEGEANRAKRLNEQLDTLISVLQFPEETGAGTSPGSEVLRPRDSSVGEEVKTKTTETKAKSKGKHLAEIERDLKMIKGTGRGKVKGKESVIHDNGD